MATKHQEESYVLGLILSSNIFERYDCGYKVPTLVKGDITNPRSKSLQKFQDSLPGSTFYSALDEDTDGRYRTITQLIDSEGNKILYHIHIRYDKLQDCVLVSSLTMFVNNVKITWVADLLNLHTGYLSSTYSREVEIPELQEANKILLASLEKLTDAPLIADFDTFWEDEYEEMASREDDLFY